MTWEKGRPCWKWVYLQRSAGEWESILDQSWKQSLFWETSCDWQPALFDFCRPLSPAEWKACVFAHYLNGQIFSLLCKIQDWNFCQNARSNETRQISELQRLCPPVLLLLCLWYSCLYHLPSLTITITRQALVLGKALWENPENTETLIL